MQDTIPLPEDQSPPAWGYQPASIGKNPIRAVFPGPWERRSLPPARSLAAVLATRAEKLHSLAAQIARQGDSPPPHRVLNLVGTLLAAIEDLDAAVGTPL